MPYLRMKCRSCGHWNRFEVDKILVEQPVSDPKVNAFIPTYAPVKAETCRKCGKCIAEPKELIRITKSKT
jgi:ribosomal protein L40E